MEAIGRYQALNAVPGVLQERSSSDECDVLLGNIQAPQLAYEKL
jgi:hypothetical protein